MADDPAGPVPGGLLDAHQHVWDLDVRPQDWLAHPELEPVRRSFSLADLRRDAAGGLLGRPLAGTVLVQVLASTPETEEFLALAARDDLVRGVVGWADLTAPGIGDELDRLAALPGGERLVAVRHLVQGEADPRWLLREDVGRGLAAVAARGLTYDLLVLPHQLPAAIELARREGGPRLVLDHAAKPPLREDGRAAFAAWQADLRALAGAGDVVCKLSGLVTEADPGRWTPADLRPAADAVLDAFGPRRVAFGSDWPVCVAAGGWARWARAAADLLDGLSPAELDDVLGATAARAYALRPWTTPGGTPCCSPS